VVAVSQGTEMSLKLGSSQQRSK